MAQVPIDFCRGNDTGQLAPPKQPTIRIQWSRIDTPHHEVGPNRFTNCPLRHPCRQPRLSSRSQRLIAMPRPLSRRELLTAAGLPAAAIVGWGLREVLTRRTSPPIDVSADDAPDLPDTPEIHGLKNCAVAIEPLFAKRSPPRPDEWLAQHEELGQTFAQYLGGRPDKLAERYATIGLVPIGEFTDTQRQLIADVAAFLPAFLGFPVEPLEALPLDDLPEDTWRLRESGARQILTAHLRDQLLLSRRTEEMAAIVGITASDVWGNGFSFLFGEASYRDRVAVCSMSRFGDVDAGEVDYATCLRRTLGVVVHETGHAFGFPHCIAYVCRMSGSNNLAESDRRPLEFCPECLPKVWWTSGIDPHDRFESLANFADEHRLTEDGNLWRAAGQRVADESRTN